MPPPMVSVRLQKFPDGSPGSRDLRSGHRLVKIFLNRREWKLKPFVFSASDLLFEPSDEADIKICRSPRGEGPFHRLDLRSDLTNADDHSFDGVRARPRPVIDRACVRRRQQQLGTDGGCKLGKWGDRRRLQGDRARLDF